MNKQILYILILLATSILVPLQAQGLLEYNVLDLRIDNRYVNENIFRKKVQNFEVPPTYEEVKGKLPIPKWPARPDVIDCYHYAWKAAFKNTHQPTKENGFVSPYIDAAFSDDIFMWDTGFIMMFAKYATNAFNFQQSLDNFYAKQQKDGYICREIRKSDGTDIFERYDLSSTGPNILPWIEWEYFLNFNNKERIEEVFAPLLAYYQWFRTYRTWQDGSYFISGWGCGVDNQPRVPAGVNATWGQAHMSWMDITLQAILSGEMLINMAELLDRQNDVKDIVEEVSYLKSYVNTKMWDDQTAFYYDRYRDGSLSGVKSVLAYWALLAEVVEKKNYSHFVDHLSNKNEFNRKVRVPALSADNPEYRADGGYWNGGVWAPVNYVVLRGLTKYNSDSLAHEIAMNNLENVVEVYKETGTLWEHYAPEMHKGMNLPNFVGWTGLVPITFLFEYVFGIRPNVPENSLVWDVRLVDEHGIDNYPYGNGGIINLHCKKRKNTNARPSISISSNVDFTLRLIWNGGEEIVNVVAKK